MLIKALCDYYDILCQRGGMLGPEYSSVPLSYCIELSPDGKLVNITDIRKIVTNAKGKSEPAPRMCVMPRRTEKPGIDANMAEHRPLYIFGLDYDKKSGTFSTLIAGKSGEAAKKPLKSHDAFVSYISNLDGIDTPVVNAFRNFVADWNPEAETQNPLLMKLGKQYPAVYYGFCLAGHTDKMLHDDAELKKRWEKLYAEKTAPGNDAVISQCAIIGDTLPIARTHAIIRGLPGGLATGNTFICFNNQSDYSYGVEQSYNSNVSEAAMRKYTAALNKLLSDRKHRSMLDDITVVYWANDLNELYSDTVSDILFGGTAFGGTAFGGASSDKLDADSAEENISLAVKAAQAGVSGLKSLNPELEENTEFYIAGLKPNSSRVAVKFVYRCRFGELFANIVQHQNDLQPFEKAKPIQLWQLKRELVNPSSDNDKADPALMSKIMDSIVNGYNYPDFMLSKVIQRIKADVGKGGNDGEKVSFDALNPTRMGMIKAYINRKARTAGKKEEISLALDINNGNPAYLCGRLFAYLEDAQQQAAGMKLNRTIKDAYFSSAASNPRIILPQLIKRAQYHIEKLSNADEIKRQIGFVMNQLGNEFPGNLPLTEQGKFMLGYYQQSSYINYKNKKQEDN